MNENQTLKLIRSTWVPRVANRMARGQEVRESFRLQLERFFDQLEQALITGDPGWLNPVLDTWIEFQNPNGAGWSWNQFAANFRPDSDHHP